MNNLVHSNKLFIFANGNINKIEKDYGYSTP